MAELLITLPQGQTRTHRLGEGSVVLGRDPACDIPLDDLGASRRHVTIRFEGGSYLLADLGSKNGTIVNEVITRGTTLRHGDEILIGAVCAVFRDDASSSAKTCVVVADDAPRQQSTKYHGRVTEADLSRRRLEILYELSGRLTRLREQEELLSDAMDVCFEMLRFERGAIAVKQPKPNAPEWPVVRNLRGTEGELKVSRTILSSALLHGERVIVNDTDDAMIDPTVSMVQNNIRSAMCVPLMYGDRNLGVIYGDRVSTGTTYSKEDIDFLAGIAGLVTTGLINAELLEQQKQKLQLENEISMAREIQTGLFPKQLPDSSHICIAAINDPGNHVSGDYYDAINLEDGRVAFLIADVTGEGVAASLLMANLQAAVRTRLATDQPLAEMIQRWNELIHSNTDASRFITFLIGLIDPHTRTLEIGAAGHHPPVIVRPGAPCSTLEIEPDYPLGVIEDATFQTIRTSVDPGPCTLVIYTDGVIEAMNADLEQYGTERVKTCLEASGEMGPKRMIERLRQEVSRHCGGMPQGDDITILAVHLP